MSTTERLNDINAKITSLTTEISNIDGATINDSDLNTCIMKRRAELQSYLDTLNNTKTELENIQTLENTALTGAQQTTVDGINTLFNNQYSRQMSSIQYMNTTQRTEFFTMYAAADTDFLREQFIKSYFKLQ